MAIEVDGKTYRNLPEQVEENANNIQWLLETIQSFGNVMRYCGSVATYDDLPTEDNKVGDVWNVLDTGNNYAWDGEAWDEISSIVDLSGYVTKIGSALPTYSNIGIQTISQFVSQNNIDDSSAIVISGLNVSPVIVNIYRADNLWHIRGISLRRNALISYDGVDGSLAFDIINNVKPIIVEDQLQDLSHIWRDEYVGDETIFSPDMKVGDTVIEVTGGQFLINEIAFDANDDLTKVILVGLEDNGNPVVHKFENGDWSSSNYINSNFVDLTSAQTITGEKTFGNQKIKIQDGSNPYWSFESGSNYLDIGSYYSGAFRVALSLTQSGAQFRNTITPNSDNSYDLGSISKAWKDAYIAGNVYLSDSNHYIRKGSGNVVEIGANGNVILTIGSSSTAIRSTFRPTSSSAIDLGGPNNKWKDLYLSGVISDGTNSVNVADLANLIAYAKAQGWIS